MSGWASVAIGQLGSVVTGRTPPSSQKEEFFDGSIPFLTPSDIDGESRIVAPQRFVSDEWDKQQARISLPAHSVCVVCIGATIGKVCMTSTRSQTNQQINSIIVDNTRFDPFFVYYRLRLMRDELKQRAAGAATPILNKTAFSELKIETPALAMQGRIGSILVGFDHLIEINRRRIALVEEMAQRLFEQWFVQLRFPGYPQEVFANTPEGLLPKGWKRVCVGEVSENLDRLRKPLSSLQRQTMSGPFPYYGAAKIFDYINAYLFDGVHLLVAEDGTVRTDDGFPVLQFVNGRFWVNNHAHVLLGRGEVSTEFLFLSLQRYPINGHITGSAQPKLTQANLNRIPIVVATDNVMRRFNANVRALLELRLSLEAANRRLATTRDLLLPRLISGELPVSAAERELETAA
jgi:type I restriction enzyme S subunit